MIRARKVRSVASFEFWCTVKRKGYLISTFGMPVFIALYGLLMSIPAYFSAKKEAKPKIYGVVDRSGLLALDGDATFSAMEEIPQEVRDMLAASGQGKAVDEALAMRGSSVFRPFDDEVEARGALQSERIKGYFFLPENFVAEGEVSAYFGEGSGMSTGDSKRHLRTLILDRMVEGKIPPEVAVRVRDPVAKWHQWTVSPDGEIQPRNLFAVVARILIPVLFAVLMIVSIMTSAGYLIQGTATEKENKVVEVLLSSVNPQEIMVGKLLGLGGAGLLQVSVWFSMIIVGGLTFAGTLQASGVEIPWMAIVAGIFFFVAGYLFIGSLMLGTGSLGNNQRESQQWSMIWVMLTIVPLVLMVMFIEDPHNGAALVMTWIPFTSALTVMLRMTLEPAGIALWEILGAFVVLVGSTYLALQFGARLFRVGLLMTGVRPKLRDILRQARLGN